MGIIEIPNVNQFLLHLADAATDLKHSGNVRDMDTKMFRYKRLHI